MEFYEWLRSQFTNIEEAKIFYSKWRDEDEQESKYGYHSLRAMAAHVSNVLEGKKELVGDTLTNYMDSKYGSEIYFS